jgi:hypothetical protein
VFLGNQQFSGASWQNMELTLHTLALSSRGYFYFDYGMVTSTNGCPSSKENSMYNLNALNFQTTTAI